MRAIRSIAPAKNFAPGGKTRARIGATGSSSGTMAAGIDEMGGRLRPEIVGEGVLAHLFPSRRVTAPAAPVALDARSALRRETFYSLMFLIRTISKVIAEETVRGRCVAPAAGRCRAHVDDVLAGPAGRPQAQRAQRIGYRRLVGVGGDVADVVDHASPTCFPAAPRWPLAESSASPMASARASSRRSIDSRNSC